MTLEEITIAILFSDCLMMVYPLKSNMQAENGPRGDFLLDPFGNFRFWPIFMLVIPLMTPSPAIFMVVVLNITVGNFHLGSSQRILP